MDHDTIHLDTPKARSRTRRIVSRLVFTMLEKFIFGNIFRECSNTLPVNQQLKANSLNLQQLMAPSVGIKDAENVGFGDRLQLVTLEMTRLGRRLAGII